MNEPQKTSAAEILRNADQQMRSLDKEQRKALVIRRNVRESRNLLQNRAQVLINLPNAVAPLLDGVQDEISERVFDTIEYLAAEAQRALDSDALFTMGVLGIPRGSQKGDKYTLEILADELEVKKI